MSLVYSSIVHTNFNTYEMFNKFLTVFLLVWWIFVFVTFTYWLSSASKPQSFQSYHANNFFIWSNHCWESFCLSVSKNLINNCIEKSGIQIGINQFKIFSSKLAIFSFEMIWKIILKIDKWLGLVTISSNNTVSLQIILSSC